MRDAGCAEDEVRLLHFLSTKLCVKVNNSLSAEFESTNGAFQGDSLSGTMFTLTLAGALNHLRAVVSNRPNPPIAHTLMPTESEYVDDVDFLDTDEGILEALLPVAKDVVLVYE